jgi:CheY-like chemotaxis protein
MSLTQHTVPPVQAAEERREPMSMEKKTRLLVAEDDDDNRFLLQAYCQGTEFELIFTENGMQAVAAYQTASFDLVLMNIQMPIMDGLTATRQIRSRETAGCRRRTPILALSANALTQDVGRATEAGCDAHLAMPISQTKFLAALRQWQTPLALPEPALDIQIPEGMEELARGYLAKRERELPVLQGLLDRSEFDDMRRIGHNLKGTGTSYGFPELTRIGKAIEEASKGTDLIALSRHLAELSNYTRTAIHHLAPAEMAAGGLDG